MKARPRPLIELTPIVVPSAADGPDGADFQVMVDLRNRINEVVRGEQAVAATAAQTLPAWQDQTDERIHGFLVHADGEPIGRALLYVPVQEDSKSADVRIEILPDWWGRGAGRHALEALTALARAHGRSVLHAWTDHLRLDGERIIARTGWGSVPDDHISRAMRGFGFTLEQVYRASALDLSQPLDRVAAVLAGARAAASDYRYVSWTLPTPVEHRAGYAWLKSRMSTDAPAGDMDFDEQLWDADRVARMDERLVAQGYTGVIGAAQHIVSGELAAYTELYLLGEDHSLPTSQNDTLVLKEHRGHRLGALVKCETLRIWREHMPESTRILTNNAEENRPMLSINEEMGFVPIAYAGMWQRTLEPATVSGP
ncbi:Acetyltransferase (GNAT) domain-containing protein [Microbacterium sp. cf046]|uniref:GNAT family N-acetyltransferase n=1 Tax=Microbacterium sp. cf046 TaxID=1761803 RepID=UPI0008E73E7F|nr:GNAT family N-acetyltransferase [Microbacterium sp. cf046]SFS06707.1 Acetyltransferase (GNAT) domain-containing protein [Microbacterium sp. cf046]